MPMSVLVSDHRSELNEPGTGWDVRWRGVGGGGGPARADMGVRCDKGLRVTFEVEVPVENGKYFRRAQAGAGWRKERPPAESVRVPGLVHETSTLYMSDNLNGDPHASVDSLYRPRNCDNVYVTGGALFPTAGSWNREQTRSGHFS